MTTLTQHNPGSYAGLHSAIKVYEANVAQYGLAFTRSTRQMNPIMSAVESNSKLAKSVGIDAEWAILSLSLAPANSSGIEVCPKRSVACTDGCLGHNSGHGCMGIGAANDRHAFTPVRRARINRTRNLFGAVSPASFPANNRAYQLAALAAIDHEIGRFAKWCAKRGLKPAVRLNAFSDIVWEVIWHNLFTRHAGVQFYDYTKIPARLGSVFRPKNYHLTFSRSEDNEAAVEDILDQQHNVAVVFGIKDHRFLPKMWRGKPVLDGTVHDKRFLDPRGHVVGLTWKGPAGKKAYSDSLDLAIQRGFAVPLVHPVTP